MIASAGFLTLFGYVRTSDDMGPPSHVRLAQRAETRHRRDIRAHWSADIGRPCVSTHFLSVLLYALRRQVRHGSSPSEEHRRRFRARPFFAQLASEATRQRWRAAASVAGCISMAGSPARPRLRPACAPFMPSELPPRSVYRTPTPPSVPERLRRCSPIPLSGMARLDLEETYYLARKKETRPIKSDS